MMIMNTSHDHKKKICVYYFRQRTAGRKKVRRRESKLYREIQALKEALKQQKKKN